MIIRQDEETITYGFDFLTSTVKLDSINRKFFESFLKVKILNTIPILI